MSKIISVENLSKRYRIGSQRSYGTLREGVSDFLRAPFRRTSSNGKIGNNSNGKPGDNRELWALKDVSFEIEEGELVGIIGGNGAGKSTLLKILSRITEPTKGRALVYGSIGSLLEVGTGFHPELNGRENVYLNGSIMGMKHSEIDRKFDEIAAFSEIEEFLETPVKYYSTGMYMRLAFSVAVHMESDILLIDEVLAVGDVGFQSRCVKKMQEVIRRGRTVILVSHNLASIQQLCKRSIWINRGRVEMIGPSEEVISKYLMKKTPPKGEYVFQETADVDRTNVLIRAVRIKDNEGKVSATIDARQPFSVEIDYEIFRELSFAWLGFALSTLTGVEILAAADGDVDHYVTTLRQPGRYTSVCRIPGGLFNAGKYAMSAYAARTVVGANPEIFVFLEHVLMFEIEHPAGVGSHMPSSRLGFFSPKLHWEVNPTGATVS